MSYKDTRVKLQARYEGQHDYINACFVDGPQSENKIIASQGPLPGTVQDFWRMISEHNVTMICTTCNLVENGRAKCALFWPEKEGDKVTRVIEQDKISVKFVG